MDTSFSSTAGSSSSTSSSAPASPNLFRRISSKLKNVTAIDDSDSASDDDIVDPIEANSASQPHIPNLERGTETDNAHPPSRTSQDAPIQPVIGGQRLGGLNLGDDRDFEAVIRGASLGNFMEDFLVNPIPIGQEVKCTIIRRKEGMEKLFPVYELLIEENENTCVFALSARKRKKSKSSNYVISTAPFVSTKLKGNVVGKVRSNFLGTSFSVFDNGGNPTKQKSDSATIRQELGAVLYEPNVLGFKGPRKMKVILPAMMKDGKRVEIRPRHEGESLSERAKTGMDQDIVVLQNKTPQWNEDTQSFVLNFNSRVLLASVKNFQIVHDDDLDYIIMQFGRVNENRFALDFRYPLSAVQAFAIALTSFDAKLACE
ncbi:Tub family-domain-containing protein [Zopfochytrium polystomum]|nr:Tub family-domain-containing protein [Zopfochytrium polystomum]